jgi:hypothetical protein
LFHLLRASRMFGIFLSDPFWQDGERERGLPPFEEILVLRGLLWIT